MNWQENWAWIEKRSFFAQNQKIEVKSIAAELTSEEKDLLLLAFDEAGGKLEPVIPEELIITGATGKEEVSGKQSIFKDFSLV